MSVANDASSTSPYEMGGFAAISCEMASRMKRRGIMDLSWKQMRIVMALGSICTGLSMLALWDTHVFRPGTEAIPSRVQPESLINFEWLEVSNGGGIGLTALRSNTAYDYGTAQALLTLHTVLTVLTTLCCMVHFKTPFVPSVAYPPYPPSLSTPCHTMSPDSALIHSAFSISLSDRIHCRQAAQHARCSSAVPSS